MKKLVVPFAVLSRMLVCCSVSHASHHGIPWNPYAAKFLRINGSESCAGSSFSEMQLHLQNFINNSFNPCDNFYNYVCHNYKQQSIPSDQDSVNHFDSLAYEVTKSLYYLLNNPMKSKWMEVQSFVNVQNLYRSCTNRGRLLNLGTSQVNEHIKALGGWPLVEEENWNETQFNWINFTYTLRNLGMKWDHFLNVYVDIDRSNFTNRIVWIKQGSNCFQTDLLLGGKNSTPVQKYVDYQVDISIFFNASRIRAKQEFQEVMEFAIRIAEISMTPMEERDITKQINKYSLKQLQKKFPFIPWLEYINTLFKDWATLTEDDKVNVASTAYLQKLSEILEDTPKRVLANYLMWFVLKESIPYLADHIKDKVKALNEDIRGMKVDVPLWKQCLDTVTQALPLQVNAMYAWYLREKENGRKHKAVNLMNHIRSATKRYILKNSWMDEHTRAKAIEKLDAMRMYVAYPDEVFNKTLLDGVYKNLKITAANFYKNMLMVIRADIEREIRLLREPINKTDWITHTWSIEVNAGYSPDENSILISAAILQGVFFDANQLQVLNYGALGFIVGHEITHGFDNMGRHFDKEGKLSSWWGNGTERNFEIKSNCVEALNNRTVIREDGYEYKLNGLLTQGETISDIGGIKLAYHAFLESHLKEVKLKCSPLQKFTSAQLFWLAAGATWCSKSRPSAMEEWKSSRTHPPDEHRVNSAVSNNAEFARDFKCPPGSPMNPYNKCVIWCMAFHLYFTFN